jgi:6-phosphogluconate dehydrogenase
VAASKVLTGPKPANIPAISRQFINDVRDALYCSKICSYAQGMALLGAANKAYNYGDPSGRDGPHLESRLHHPRDFSR